MPHVAFHTFPVPEFSSPAFSSLAFSAPPLVGVDEQGVGHCRVDVITCHAQVCFASSRWKLFSIGHRLHQHRRHPMFTRLRRHMLIQARGRTRNMCWHVMRSYIIIHPQIALAYYEVIFKPLENFGIWCRVFQSCVFHPRKFHDPAFFSPAFSASPSLERHDPARRRCLHWLL